MANNVAVKDATNTTVTVKSTDNAGVHTPHHNVDSSALPSGAATSAKQDTEIGHLATLAGAVAGTEVQADILTSALPTGAATSAKQDTQITAEQAIQVAVEKMDDWDNTASDGASVSGDVAHDGVDAGEPVKIGAIAIAHGTNPTAVAAADRTNLYANRAGVLFTMGGHPNTVTVAAAYTAAQTDTAIVTVAGGLKIVVTAIEVTADKANTVDVGFYIGFHATTTPTTTGVVAAHPGLAAGSGLIKGNGGGILGVGGDGDDLRITAEAPTTGSIRVVVTYFTIES